MSEEKETMPEFIFGSFLLSALAVVLVVLYFRHRNQQMLHQERMAALEKGVDAPLGQGPAPWSPRVYLFRGMVWSFSGLAVIACLLLAAAAEADRRKPSAEDLAYRTQNVSRALSISPEEAKRIVAQDAQTNPHSMPYAVSTLGLLPLAVGLAYLVFYYTDDSRKRNGGA